MPKDAKKKLILIGLGVFGLVFYCSNMGRRRHAAGNAGKSALPNIADNGIATQSHPKAISSPQVSPEVERARRLMAAEVKLGMIGLPLLDQNGTKVLPVTVEITKVCHYGDADAMLSDIRTNLSGKIIMTLEPLSASSRGVVSQRVITAADLKEGFSHHFQVPKVDRPAPYGVFICMDSHAKGSCRGLPNIDYSTLKQSGDVPMSGTLGAQAADSAQNSRTPDQIYAFQYVLVTSDTVKGLSRSPAEGEGFKALINHAADAGIPADLAAKAIGEVQNEVSALNSMPIAVQDHHVIISLPRIKPECDPKQFKLDHL